MLKAKLVAVAVLFAVFGNVWAQTASEQKQDAKPAAAEEKKVAPSRHEHARDHKQGAPASTTADSGSSQTKKKPLHDHGRMHKQQ